MGLAASIQGESVSREAEVAIMASSSDRSASWRVLQAALVIAVLAGGAEARAQSTWTGTTGGEWGTAANWTGGVPNAIGAVANINTALTVNLSDTGTGGTYPYTFGTLATTIASGSVVLGNNSVTTDILTAQTSSATPVINVANSGGTIFYYANLEGTQGFEKTGAGKLTWRFNGADQNYSGNVLISGGILGINQNGSLGDDNNDITIASGARLLAEPGGNSGTITLPATRTITLTGAQSQIGSNNANVNLVIQGAVTESGTGQGLVKTDPGVVTLQGTLSYTGETRITAGTLALASSALLPSSQNLRFNGATGTLDIGSTSQTVRTIVMDNTAGNKTITGAGGSLLVNGAATLQLGGGNGVTYSFAGLNSFTFDRSTSNFNVQTVNAAGVANVMDVNLATGGVGGGTNSITAAQIQVGGGNSDGNNGNTARLHLGTTNTFRTATFSVGGFNAGGVVDFQSGLTNPSLTLRGTDGTSAATTWTVGESSSGSRTGQGVVNLTGGSLDAIATDVRIGRHVAGSNLADTSSLTMPAGSLTATTLTMAAKTGGGTPTLTSAFNQSGGTVSIGTITLGDGGGDAAAVLLPTYNLTGGSLAATSIGAGAGANYNTTSSVRTLNIDGGTLRNLTGTDLVVNGLGTTSSGRINLTLGASGGTLQAESGRSITLGANTAVTGSGGLTKTGSGSLVVGVNTAYTGATAVNGGTLLVTGALSGSSAVSIAAGATLGGAGSVAGPTTIAGIHAPGNSPGVQSFGDDLTYSGGTASVIWELNGNTSTQSQPTAIYDQVVVAGNLDFAAATALSLVFDAAGSTVDWADAFWDVDQTWTFYDVAGTTSNSGNLSIQTASWLDSNATGLAAARPLASFSLTQSGEDVQILYAAVPEPAALGLAAAAAAGLAILARRRHHERS
jgi:autotransporter-associated beta strand protein